MGGIEGDPAQGGIECPLKTMRRLQCLQAMTTGLRIGRQGYTGEIVLPAGRPAEVETEGEAGIRVDQVIAAVVHEIDQGLGRGAIQDLLEQLAGVRVDDHHAEQLAFGAEHWRHRPQGRHMGHLDLAPFAVEVELGQVDLALLQPQAGLEVIPIALLLQLIGRDHPGAAVHGVDPHLFPALVGEADVADLADLTVALGKGQEYLLQAPFPGVEAAALLSIEAVASGRPDDALDRRKMCQQQGIPAQFINLEVELPAAQLCAYRQLGAMVVQVTPPLVIVGDGDDQQGRNGDERERDQDDVSAQGGLPDGLSDGLV